MEMAELSRSMQRKSPTETNLSGSASEERNKMYRPWLQQSTPASNGILHIPTNMLSPKTLHSLMHGKKATQMESTFQNSGKQVVNKKQNIPPRGLVKPIGEANESVRSKMRESLASALAVVLKEDEFLKVNENSETEEASVMTVENTQSFQPVSPASINVPISEGTMSELPTGVESCVQKESEISIDIGMEDTNQSEGLKSQYDEVFPRDDVSFTDIIFTSDDLLQGNELSWALDNVSDLEERKDYGTNGEKSFQDPELLASKIEMELFKLFGGVNKKYREKGRSLLFNLKDKNNPELRKRVMSEEISAERLCSMTAEELASKELSQWRQAKAEKMAEMVVLRDTDIDVRRLVRKTHKGEFQVEIDPVDTGTVDVSVGITSRSRRQPKAKSHSAKTTLKDNKAKVDQATPRDTPPSTELIDPMQGLAVDDELKDVEFLPPIVSLDEFMESLDSEPPFESPHGISGMQASASEKSDSEVGSQSKYSKGSPKELSGKSSPEPKPEKIDEISPKSDTSVKLDGGDVSKLEKTSELSDVKGEKVWDGILQLSMSSVIPVTAIFKSGEKAEMSDWPTMVEVKGRVRLSGFEKFIQELPKSRTRALMVMYLACKDGISRNQRGSLFEVIDSYVADSRVGYAEPSSGVELYLCPTRGKTLELLTKVILKDQLEEVKSLGIDLVGVVIWRRAGSKRYISDSVLSENKKQKRVNVIEKEKPLVITSMENHHLDDGDDDDVPPGFGPVGSRDEEDLPEFNFNSSARQVSSPRLQSLDQVRKLIHKYGKSANVYDDEDDDDIPEWQPHNSSHQLPPPPPPAGFRPMVRPGQEGWWDNQNGGSGQHYNWSRNRGL